MRSGHLSQYAGRRRRGRTKSTTRGSEKPRTAKRVQVLVGTQRKDTCAQSDEPCIRPILVSADGSSFRWAGAGHVPPRLEESKSRDFSEPIGGHVPPGIMCDHVFDDYESLLGPPGSILLTGTDVIWETANAEKSKEKITCVRSSWPMPMNC